MTDCLVFAVETLRQLILRDLDEDRWSHNSDDTPTNETANGRRSSLAEEQRPESLETVLNFSTDDYEAEAGPEPSDNEQHNVQVVRKGKGGSSERPSLPYSLTVGPLLKL